ncbi:hypothetical protein KM043_012745 [Ampulex compressa]|nr:hypothetical protein KM043_012745 [Ampulex compressa]
MKTNETSPGDLASPSQETLRIGSALLRTRLRKASCPTVLSRILEESRTPLAPAITSDTSPTPDSLREAGTQREKAALSVEGGKARSGIPPSDPQHARLSSPLELTPSTEGDSRVHSRDILPIWRRRSSSRLTHCAPWRRRGARLAPCASGPGLHSSGKRGLPREPRGSTTASHCFPGTLSGSSIIRRRGRAAMRALAGTKRD